MVRPLASTLTCCASVCDLACAGIGPYELWRAKLLATLGYTGRLPSSQPSATNADKRADLWLAYAAFVVDVYSQNIVQGPSMPVMQRSQLSSAFQANPALFTDRIHAGLDEVHCSASAALSAFKALLPDEGTGQQGYQPLSQN